MIETHGFALEAVSARSDLTPPLPGYTYTVGLPQATGFPEIVVMGLTPAACMQIATSRSATDVLQSSISVPLPINR